MYVCAACGHPLFEALKKFEAGCGFPSFWMHKEDGVKLNPLSTYGRERIQLLCNHCGQHLGHLFANKDTPTGIRYCISKEAIELVDSGQKTTGKTEEEYIPSMASTEAIMQTIKENRSSESNFGLLLKELEKARTMAQQENNQTLAGELQEVKEKYAASYQKAKETGGTAWPEFEKFITEFERSLLHVKED